MILNTTTPNHGFTAAVVTVSDKASQGLREDASGAVAAAMLAAAGYAVVSRTVVPDDRDRIRDELVRQCDEERAALVLTTGGTGFAPRDVTPEATLAAVDRLCPGIPEAMRLAGLAKTRKAMLSRAAAGIRGTSLIVNLPGSPRAVRECLEAIVDELVHGLAVLRGETDECAVPEENGSQQDKVAD